LGCFQSQQQSTIPKKPFLLAGSIPNTILYEQFGMFSIPATKQHPQKAFSPSWQHPKHYALRAVWDVFDLSSKAPSQKSLFP